VQTTLWSMIDFLRNVSVLFRQGAQRVAGQVGNIALPKQTGAGTTAWLSTETAQVSESNATFSQVAGTGKTVAITMDMSRQLLKQISPDTEAAVKRSLAANIALAGDNAGINGTGASGQPTGILNTAGIGTASGTTLGHAALVEVQVDVADSNAILNPNTLGYVTTPSVAQTLTSRQQFASTDSPVWQGAIHQGMVEGLLAISSKQMPASTLLYGDWSSVLVPEWGSLIVEVDPFSNFKTGIVSLRCLWTIDILVTQPAAFSAISSIS
jgi:HK97 family phage major capsid protein